MKKIFLATLTFVSIHQGIFANDFVDLFPKEKHNAVRVLERQLFGEEAVRKVEGEWGQSFKMCSSHVHTLVKEVRKRKKDGDSVRVLEIGCAAGELALTLQLAGADTVVLNDILPTEIERAKKNAAAINPNFNEKGSYNCGVTFICSDVEEAFQSEGIRHTKFDIIIGLNVLHFMEPTKAQRVFKLMDAHLSPNGLLYYVSNVFERDPAKMVSKFSYLHGSFSGHPWWWRTDLSCANWNCGPIPKKMALPVLSMRFTKPPAGSEKTLELSDIAYVNESISLVLRIEALGESDLDAVRLQAKINDCFEGAYKHHPAIENFESGEILIQFMQIPAFSYHPEIGLQFLGEGSDYVIETQGYMDRGTLKISHEYTESVNAAFGIFRKRNALRL